MARRRRRVVTPAVWIDWSASVAALFEPYQFATRDMRAPDRVRVYAGAAHTTIVARFLGVDGEPGRITMRIPAP